MITPDIPLLDISLYREGTANQRGRLIARMDEALRRSGFLLIENHGWGQGFRARRRGRMAARPRGGCHRALTP
jgi:isopenicillin N synthase-like dioxygenase